MFGFLKRLLSLPESVSAPPKSVSAPEAAALVRAGQAVMLDVRSGAERRATYIPGSLHIPLDELSAQAATLPADKTLICQCASGRRSARAARELAGRGLNTLNLRGGLSAWQAAELPLK